MGVRCFSKAVMIRRWKTQPDVLHLIDCIDQSAMLSFAHPLCFLCGNCYSVKVPLKVQDWWQEG